jgi:hypothetical protein
VARGGARGGKGTARPRGFVEKVFPELVTTDEQGNKQVAYDGLIGPLIEAVKELDARVRALEARLGAGGREDPTGM